MKKKYDICIIGGGASGCIAAVSARIEDSGCSICIVEKNKDILRKVAASGNGRCNISNSRCDYNPAVEDFFASMGVYFAQEDDGRLYPYSRSSRSVTEAIRRRLDKDGIDIFCGTEVISVDKGFTVHTGKGDIQADKLLIAAGGKSAPEFGTTGDGFRFAKAMGHTVTPLRPSLTAIDCEGPFNRLKGCRAFADVTLRKDGRAVATEYGEVQFTETGLSGICIFNLSRYLKIDEGESLAEGMKRYSISVNFVPDIDEERLKLILENGGMISLLKKPLLDTVKEDELRDWTVQVKGARGWRQSQVTAGGVALGEIEFHDMESQLVDGLYFAGEVIDYDGPCGGYNLNNAWITGIRAGKAMASHVQDKSV